MSRLSCVDCGHEWVEIGASFCPSCDSEFIYDPDADYPAYGEDIDEGHFEGDFSSYLYSENDVEE